LERRKAVQPDVVFRDRQLVISRTHRPPGLRLVGAVDASNVDGLAQALAMSRTDASKDGHVVHVDLTMLEFTDVSGIRALVASAQQAAESYRMVLHGLPPLMRRVMDAVGWTELPALEISREPFPSVGGRNGDRLP